MSCSLAFCPSNNLHKYVITYRKYRLIPKIWEWAKYQNRHSSKSIWVMKLFFCQNNCHIKGEFWQKNRFINSYNIWAILILIFSPVQIIMTHPLGKALQLRWNYIANCTLQIYTVFNCVHFPLQSRCTVYIFYHIQ